MIFFTCLGLTYEAFGLHWREFLITFVAQSTRTLGSCICNLVLDFGEKLYKKLITCSQCVWVFLKCSIRFVGYDVSVTLSSWSSIGYGIAAFVGGFYIQGGRQIQSPLLWWTKEFLRKNEKIWICNYCFKQWEHEIATLHIKIQASTPAYCPSVPALNLASVISGTPNCTISIVDSLSSSDKKKKKFIAT